MVKSTGREKRPRSELETLEIGDPGRKRKAGSLHMGAGYMRRWEVNPADHKTGVYGLRLHRGHLTHGLPRLLLCLPWGTVIWGLSTFKVSTSPSREPKGL